MSTTAVNIEKLSVNTIRTLAMDAVERAKSGHPGTPMALAPIAHVLFTRVMRHSPRHPGWPNRDRFVLSAGHASMLLYAVLYLTGYDVSVDDLKRFRQLGSPTAGHPEYGHLPGVEATTGPLGQGIATSTGLALGERMLNARFGDALVDYHTFVVAGDGDLQEGVSGEAASLAGHLGLGRLVAFYDDNHISIEGDTSLAFSEDVGARYTAYGWHVQDLGEDLSLDRIEEATRTAMDVGNRPSLIICRTHIAYGSPHKQDTHAAHGAPLGEEEVRLTKEAYGWPTEEPFSVPDEALALYRTCVERGEELERPWRKEAEATDPEALAELERLSARQLPESFPSQPPPRFEPADQPTLATRKAGEAVLQWAAREVPELVGGSADLAPSTLATIADGGDVARDAYAGRNLHFGIREHAMGAAVNGLTLSGLRAYGAGFLIFSDYMKAAVRLSSLMAIPSIWIFTHDSIGLGEDGPTHQPVEQLAMLRAQPNLYVVRPAGANETTLAWRFALEQTETPVAICLSRQALPVWRPGRVPADAVERGAYVLREGYKREPDVVLLASGSEVALCNAAADLLELEGVSPRVVSMPCLERFRELETEPRDEVLPRDVPTLAVEAASPDPWYRYADDVIGMEGFGASAPARDLFQHFGFTAPNVADRAAAIVRGTRA
jgi:transketolase